MAVPDSRVTIHMAASLDGFIARTEFLRKPITVADLTESIRRAMERD
ncbi:MAG TPA: hypothetical protein VLB00_01045 [Gemmatimonadales bacterium]|nr:hypothetical protein [Gemmatimonadales bacterium]